MQETLTQAIEDYLKIIYEITSKGGRASTNEIADAMRVKPASVTKMIQRLAAADPPLITYQKHRGVALTPRGERTALQKIRHHRLLERFLYDVMGFPWDELYVEAHRIEHVVSVRFEERMCDLLKDPRYDPHGAPIPTRDHKIPTQVSQPLSELSTGQRVIVKRVPCDDPELLRYLGQYGVAPEARIVILERSSLDGNLKIQVEVLETSPLDGKLRLRPERGGEAVVLGPNITRQIFVEFAG
ncbi:MAG: metal-dependent transcriptional regulator [Anaerolineales bacterium]|nr:metal-dependent transcriptional regulator [Anaerolineales bacterium]